jgi:hypothetical protein
MGLSQSAQAQVPSITLTPGTIAGYIPLNIFGTAPLAGVTDDSITNLNVPSFHYAGEVWTSVGFSSNGYLIVGGSAGGSDNTPVNTLLPNASGPKNVLAPFWTNLNPEAGGSLFVATLTDGINVWTVFEWQNVRNFSSATTNSFQVWIGTNGTEDIAFSYGSVGNGDAGLLTVGASDKTGTVGDTRYFNGVGTLPSLNNDLRVTSSNLPVAVAAPEPGSLALLALSGLPVVGAVVRRRRSV